MNKAATKCRLTNVFGKLFNHRLKRRNSNSYALCLNRMASKLVMNKCNINRFSERVESTWQMTSGGSNNNNSSYHIERQRVNWVIVYIKHDFISQIWNIRTHHDYDMVFTEFCSISLFVHIAINTQLICCRRNSVCILAFSLVSSRIDQWTQTSFPEVTFFYLNHQTLPGKPFVRKWGQFVGFGKKWVGNMQPMNGCVNFYWTTNYRTESRTRHLIWNE